ncbi:hypothetical protein JKP88DRAFT_282921 [Tribonema minus]|uniref:Uncharacterized protein n=1 Tax=Tribonema minus TaxID=303371 RepID=A0A836C865_9STRA|nr:hypothetical protein JKP88DRAFT_282921 [Tribonema minus]
MGGFGDKKSSSGSSNVGSGLAAARKQQKLFLELVEAKEPVAFAYARAKGSETWHRIAEVAAKGGNFAAAVQGQKRLMLDHAVQLHPVLLVSKATLEVGFATEEGGEVTVVAKDAYAGETVGVRLDAGNAGPFYKVTDQFGLSGRIDTKSAAGKSTQGGKGGATGGGMRTASSGKSSSDGA